MSTHIYHVSATNEADFQRHLDDALDEIQGDLTPFEVVNIQHAVTSGGEGNSTIVYSALIVYRQTGPTREIPA